MTQCESGRCDAMISTLSPSLCDIEWKGWAREQRFFFFCIGDKWKADAMHFNSQSALDVIWMQMNQFDTENVKWKKIQSKKINFLDEFFCVCCRKWIHEKSKIKTIMNFPYVNSLYVKVWSFYSIWHHKISLVQSLIEIWPHRPRHFSSFEWEIDVIFLFASGCWFFFLYCSVSLRFIQSTSIL